MLLIVWHSRTGASEGLAKAAHAGALDEGPVRLLPAAETKPEDMLAAAGYVFACPENLGTMSGVMKEFFDRSYYPLLGRIEGRAFATIVAAGSDGSGAQAQIERIATGWRLRRIAGGIIVNLHAQTPEAILAPKILPANSLQMCRELGQLMGAGLAMGAF